MNCGTTTPVPGTHSTHYCGQPKGHEPLWHQCSCGHAWRPVPLPEPT